MMICEHKQCTNCMACFSKCPKQCISMEEDKYGVRYPVINTSVCIECGLCKNVCPANGGTDKKTPTVTYAAWTQNEQEHKKSSSGGVAAVFYRNMLQKSGVVFGTSYDDNLQLSHSYTDDIEKIAKYQGSKYSQSDVGISYQQVKKILNDGRQVLFIGTPCQIDGLLHFLGENPDGLVTVDLICHGVPPQRYINDHVYTIEEKLKRKADRLTFRGENDYRFTLYKGLESIYSADKYEDIYFIGFLKGLFFHEKCYQCSYAKKERVSDITIGDFWGLGKTIPFIEEKSKDGISVVLLNTEKGRSFFKVCQKDLHCVERTLEEAVSGNPQLRRPAFKHPKYDRFRELYPKQGFDKAAKHSLMKELLKYKIKKLLHKS